MPLIDWLIHRGHITEEQIASVLAYCLRLAPLDPAAGLSPCTKAKPAAGPRAHRAQLSLLKTAERGPVSRGAARPAGARRHSLRVVK